ncbi:hypothetical protein FA13DRAFT_1132486 [Coprinellus micaceus]|uniref:Uncharacterized protein n=1 Tax=Coprinellus micaceus TaxID=71717 RepID=A0A4Y7SVI6_COPMI|nr:hypothetical protein FA13DRAFT_1132486 [Coprinellus micaceus]
MKKAERKRPAQHDGPKAKKQRVENVNVPYGKKIAKVIYAVNDEQEDDSEDPFEGGEDPLSMEKFEALMREVNDGDSGSEDEYAPKGNSGDEDDNDDEGGELEDDEDDAQLEKKNKKNKKGEKKERAGVSARRLIRELQLPDGNDEMPTRTTKKPSAKPTGKRHRDGGLKPNWKQQDVLLPPPIKKPRTEPTKDDEDGPMQQFGSLIGDDEDPGPERAGLALMESSMSIPVCTFTGYVSPIDFRAVVSVFRRTPRFRSSSPLPNMPTNQSPVGHHPTTPRQVQGAPQ